MKGLTNKFRSEYCVWHKMIRRCHNPNDNSYEDYGLEGIKVCARWKGSNGFKNFLEDMGSRPKGEVGGIHIDRVDSDYGYTPWNCRWTTRRENMLNRSTTRWIEHGGFKMCVRDWAKALGMDRRTLSARLNLYGWSIEKALTTPLRGSI